MQSPTDPTVRAARRRPVLPVLRCLVILAAAVSSGTLYGQEPPGTDIYLVLLSETGDADPGNAPVNITSRKGYDNQPMFTPEGRALWFTRIADGQADIYRYDLIRDSVIQVTDTPESEYSPTPRPGHRGITVVRVEADERQRLWHFAPGSDPVLLFPELEPVGYFDWHDPDRVVVFILGSPVTLQSAMADGTPRILAEEIGRSIRRLPDGRIAFVDKQQAPWRIRAVSLPDGEISTLAEIPDHTEDFAVGPDGALWLATGSRLQRWRPETGWREVADFADAGLTSITRLAIAPDGRCIAFVADDAPSAGTR